MPDKNYAKEITWDLSDLYSSLHDPKIHSDLKLTKEKAIAFENKYKPLFFDMDAIGRLPLHELLRDYKELNILTTCLGVFAHLTFAGKTNDAAVGAFQQKIQESLTDIQTHLLFFDVKWNKLDEMTAARLMADPRLKEDLHFLEKSRAYAHHTLAEGEEKIMAIKANTSGGAFSRLFDETVNNIPFYLETNGQRAKKTEGEVLAFLNSTHREERKKASESLAEGLKAHSRILTYIYNMILADHRASLKIRNFKHPMDAMNLSNEIDLAGVQNLIQSVKNAYSISSRYYSLKRKLLGVDKLYDYDRYAHVGADDAKIDFKECKQIVLDGYFSFSDEAGKIVEQFFEKRWIDAEVREGKYSGGFCCSTTPDLHPYILVNYTGSLRDVMVVAHELGHGLHQYLAAKRVGILESSAPLTLAETASVFGEMLIFEKIMEKEKDPKKRLSLLCGKIDDNLSTVHRQIVLTDFELRAHETGLKEGELFTDQLSDFWIKANAEMYGDSVELTENYRYSWKYIPHFIHSPFYCYAYTFAQLFVLTLYQKYKEDKKSFIPKYFEMLSLGGSRKPKEIAAIMGLDIEKQDFWQSGIALLEKMVTEAENLAK